MPILETIGSLEKRFGGITATSGISFAMEQGARQP